MNRLLARALRIVLASTVLFFWAAASHAQASGDGIKLDTIAQMPAEIDGCSALYAVNETLLKKRRYLFVSDFADTGYLRVNGKLLHLTLRRKNVYQGAGYTVVVKTASKRIADELYSEVGDILISRGKRKLVIHVVGESGC